MAQSQAKKYGIYQNEIYLAGMMHGIRPTLTTDPNKLEQQAKEKMSATSYAYVAGGAGERATIDANRLAFRQWKLVPRMLRDTTGREISVNLFGVKYPTPILCAPVGVQSIFHTDGESGVAEVAAQVGVTYINSTASSHTMEDVAAANDRGAQDGAKAQRWFQLYWPYSKDITESILARAEKAGYTTLVVTLDTWALAWRPWDLDLAYVPFFKGVGNATGFSDPVFREHFKKQSGKEVEEDIVGASAAWIGDLFSGASHQWEDLSHIRALWKGPILVKGIQHPDDAVKAYQHGMDGVIVSNHGGRQLDGAIGSLEMLPEIVDAVKDKKSQAGYDFTVLFDSGVRTGVDVLKVLCLGAKAVLVGRPWVYGLGINGKQGAKAALQGLLADTEQSMGLAGMKNIGECTRAMVRRIDYGGDRASNN